MKIFEGKSPTERNKIIAALVLGVLALFVLSYTFIIPLFSSKTKITVSMTPTPKPSVLPNGATVDSTFPTQAESDFTYSTTPIFYTGTTYAPDAGRNIFAFYEPPPPTPYSPTPIPTATPYNGPTPTPIPPPPIALYSAARSDGASIYAGQPGFLLEVSGDKFTPDSQVSVNGAPVPTTYYNPQRLTAEIPASYIANAATLFITVTTPGGLYSNQVSLGIQAPPVPQFQYIGPVLAKGNNNNKAYIKEGTNIDSRRLNDVIGGRFRIISIAKNEIVVRDINLGFPHTVRLLDGGGQNTKSSTQTNPNYNANPNQPVYQEIPGIPNNIPRYNPNSNVSPLQQPQQKQQQEKDYDDDEDGDN